MVRIISRILKNGDIVHIQEEIARGSWVCGVCHADTPMAIETMHGRDSRTTYLCMDCVLEGCQMLLDRPRVNLLGTSGALTITIRDEVCGSLSPDGKHTCDFLVGHAAMCGERSELDPIVEWPR